MLAWISKRGIAIAALAMACVCARVARADDAAGADVLFTQAKALMDQDKPAEACPKFEASYGLERRLGTLLNWADCEEKIGRIVQAEDHFREARDLAVRTGDPRSDYAEKRRSPLPARFAKLRLDVKMGAEKLQIWRDGARVDETSFGLFEAANPLVTEIVVRRDDDVLETMAIKLEEGQERSIALDLIAISKAHPKKGGPVIRVSQTQRVAGFVVGGVGVAGLIGFAILEGLAYGRRADALEPGRCLYDSGSDTYVCTPIGYQLHSEAGDLAEAGQWTGIASGVVVAVGVTLLATAPRGVVAAEGGKPVVSLDTDGFYLGWRGRFE